MKVTLRKALVLAAVSGAAASAASAQSITTLFSTNNNGGLGGGIYFQIVVGPTPITINSIDTNTGAIAAGVAVPFRIFTAPTTYVGNEANPAAWTLASTGSGTGAGLNLPTAITLSTPVVLSASTSYGIALTLSDASGTPPSLGHYYSGTGASPLPGALQYSNPDLTLNLGDATNVLFAGAPFNPRVWNGTIYYSIGGTTGACCRTDGSCAQSSSAGCTASGGTYGGNGVSCAAANCPAGGACCLPGFTCATLTAVACAAQSGTYRGDGVACAAANCPLPPGIWIEVGDAGDLPASAQVTVGNGALNEVRGNLAGDADMYKISICDIANFSATTAGGTTIDTQLFLFDASGMGVVANDDSVGFQSTINNTTGCLTGGNGDYYLAMSNYDFDPSSAGGLIFPSAPFTTVFCPTGPGGGSPISGWTGAGGAIGSYSIFLTGACFSQASGAACYANCDHSTVLPCLNVQDFTCFLNKFASADTYANCDNSTLVPVLNVQDFTCFLNRFASGCSNC